MNPEVLLFPPSHKWKGGNLWIFHFNIFQWILNSQDESLWMESMLSDILMHYFEKTLFSVCTSAYLFKYVDGNFVLDLSNVYFPYLLQAVDSIYYLFSWFFKLKNRDFLCFLNVLVCKHFDRSLTIVFRKNLHSPFSASCYY